MLRVFDDVLPEGVFQELRDEVFDEKTPWYFLNDSAYSDEYGEPGQSSFYNTIYLDGEVESPKKDFFEKIVNVLLMQTNTSIDTLYRIRLGLHVSSSSSVPNKAHIDDERPHTVGLLYLNDSDGDTLIYKEKYDPREGLGAVDSFKKLDSLTISDRVTPRANRLVIFDGHTYHASSTPTYPSSRRALNFNFV